MLRPLLVLCTLALAGFTQIRISDEPGAPYLRWSKGFQVPIHVHGGGYSRLPFANVRAALESAMASWNAADGADFTFIRDPAGRDADTPVADEINVIRFEERDVPAEIDPESTLAWTAPLSVACTGILLEADITFNAVNFVWSLDGSRNDIESTAVHELGHLLGLDHSRDRRAVMFPTSEEGDVVRNLNADDLAGIRAIYPPARGLACQRNGDCGGGEVCLYTIRSDDVLDTFCGPTLGATAPGGRCNAGQGPCDGGCANGLCFNDNQCSAVCAADRDCPAGWTCLPQGDGDSLCVDLVRCQEGGDCPAGQACGLTVDGNDDLLQLCVDAGNSPDGTPCEAGDECAGGICFDTCTRLCGGAADCADGLTCTPVDAGAGTVDLCILPDVPCGRDRDCPEGLVCAYVAVDDGLANRCAPSDGSGAGVRCFRDSDCRAGLCVDSICSAVCRNDGDCPESMECGRVTRDGTALPACVPLDAPPRDLGVPEEDAEVPDPERDSGVVERDAAPERDARPQGDRGVVEPTPDARPPEPDAVMLGVTFPAPADDGCATTSGGHPVWPLLAVVGFCRRRRKTA